MALLDPKVRGMREELEELNRKLTSNDIYIPPEGQRSPSPDPIYDAMGNRLNTREIRAREKLVETRHKLVEDLIKEDPTFRPPADYKPRKFSHKVYIPINEFPAYKCVRREGLNLIYFRGTLMESFTGGAWDKGHGEGPIARRMGRMPALGVESFRSQIFRTLFLFPMRLQFHRPHHRSSRQHSEAHAD